MNGSPAYTPTGHSGADKVLRELEERGRQPVSDHAAAYQSAHDALTAVLDAPVNAMPARNG